MTTKRRLGLLFVAGALTVGYVSAVHAQINFTLQDQRPLAAFGPVDARTGYPIWIQDVNGTKLEACFDTIVFPDPLFPNDPAAACPACIDPALDLPLGAGPIDFLPWTTGTPNFPEEAFYMLASSLLDTAGGGRALLVVALECAFDGLGTVQNTEQIVFSRLRVRIDNLQENQTYTITHPYGQVAVTAAGATGAVRGINISNDVFVWKEKLGGVLSGGIGNFGEFLHASTGPFSPGITNPPDGPYIGDPCIDTEILGSPFGTNIFRIEGPGIGEPGSPFLCRVPRFLADGITPGPIGPAGVDCIETDLFSLVGKEAARAGAVITRATYQRDAALTQIDVWANSATLQDLVVSGDGIGSVPMTRDGANYYAHLVHSSNLPVPAQITVTNITDDPPTTSIADLADDVEVVSAIYDLDAINALGAADPTLTVTSRTRRTGDAGGSQAALTYATAALNPPPTTTGLDLVNATTGSLTTALTSIFVPPAAISATSSFKGSDEVPVLVMSNVIPLSAAAGPDLIAPVSIAGPTPVTSTVTLDGSNSLGATTITWTQVVNPGDPSVTLIDAAVAPQVPGSVVTFDMPVGPGEFQLEFVLSVGNGIDTLTDMATVFSSSIANAGPDQPIAPATLVGGDAVTLDGSLSTLVFGTPSWTQLASSPTCTGTSVMLDLADPVHPTFTIPLSGGCFDFQLDVTGPGGLATDFVQIIGGVGPPIANAGPNQIDALLDTVVTLDGSGSLGVFDTYQWTQILGLGSTAVNLGIFDPDTNGINMTLGTNVPDPAFALVGATPGEILTFQLIVSDSAPLGLSSAADTVEVIVHVNTGPPPVDPCAGSQIQIAPGKAAYDAAKAEWKIEGTAAALQDLVFYLGDPTSEPLLENTLGPASADNGGKFKLQPAVTPGSGTDPTAAIWGGTTPALNAIKVDGTGVATGGKCDLPFN